VSHTPGRPAQAPRFSDAYCSPSEPPHRSSARFAERILYGIGMMRDHRKENARRAIRPGSPLFPVSYRGGSESESRRKPRLAEAEVLSNGQRADRSGAIYLDLGDADAWNALASGVCEGLVEAGQKGAARDRTLRRPLLGLGLGLLCHCYWAWLLPLECSAVMARMRPSRLSSSRRMRASAASV